MLNDSSIDCDLFQLVLQIALLVWSALLRSKLTLHTLGMSGPTGSESVAYLRHVH